MTLHLTVYVRGSVCGRKHTFERHLYGMEAVLSSREKGNSSKERLREVVEGSKREEVNKHIYIQYSIVNSGLQGTKW